MCLLKGLGHIEFSSQKTLCKKFLMQKQNINKKSPKLSKCPVKSQNVFSLKSWFKGQISKIQFKPTSYKNLTSAIESFNWMKDKKRFWDWKMLRKCNDFEFLCLFSKATEKTMFCFVSAIYWIENKNLLTTPGNVLLLKLVFS